MTPTTDRPQTDGRGIHIPSSDDDTISPAPTDTTNLSAIIGFSAPEAAKSRQLTQNPRSISGLAHEAARAGSMDQCQGQRVQGTSPFCWDKVDGQILGWEAPFPCRCPGCSYDDVENLDNIFLWGVSPGERPSTEDKHWLFKFGHTDVDDGEAEELDEGLVISRSALPKGSVLYEQVLDEVAPEMRGVNESSAVVTVIRPRSLRDRYDEDDENTAHQTRQSLIKKISWADQKGLPLKSEVYFGD